MQFYLTAIVVICAFSLDFAYGGGHGGGGPGLVLIQNNKNRNKQGDMILFQNECGPGIIKDGGRKGKNILVLPQCQKKKIKKEIKYMPIAVPVKEYIPVPMHMHKAEGGMGGMDMGMGMGMDSMQMPVEMGMDSMGMDTKTSITHATPDDTKRVVRKVIKIRKQNKSNN